MVLNFEISMTPLHFASQSGSLGITKILIKFGANIKAKTNMFQKLLYCIQHMIIYHFKYKGILFYLYETPLDIANSRNQFDIVSYLKGSLML